MLEFLINKVAGFQACNFNKKILRHRCFPVNIGKFLRTTILKNIYIVAKFHGSPVRLTDLESFSGFLTS